jgi:hypothetical protein
MLVSALLLAPLSSSLTLTLPIAAVQIVQKVRLEVQVASFPSPPRHRRQHHSDLEADFRALVIAIAPL